MGHFSTRVIFITWKVAKKFFLKIFRISKLCCSIHRTIWPNFTLSLKICDEKSLELPANQYAIEILGWGCAHPRNSFCYSKHFLRLYYIVKNLELSDNWHARGSATPFILTVSPRFPSFPSRFHSFPSRFHPFPCRFHPFPLVSWAFHVLVTTVLFLSNVWISFESYFWRKKNYKQQ